VNPIDFIIFSLATWRIASLFAREDGPFFMFRKLREHIGITHDEDGKVFEVPDTFLAGALSCVWCCSMWVAAGWTIFWFLVPILSVKCALLFALATGAVLIDKLVSLDVMVQA